MCDLLRLTCSCGGEPWGPTWLVASLLLCRPQGLVVPQLAQLTLHRPGDALVIFNMLLCIDHYSEMFVLFYKSIDWG